MALIDYLRREFFKEALKLTRGRVDEEKQTFLVHPGPPDSGAGITNRFAVILYTIFTLCASKDSKSKMAGVTERYRTPNII